MTGVLRLMLSRESLDRFRREHVTLVELAREAGVSPVLVWRRLSAAGVGTAADHRRVGAVIYRRDELARHLEHGTFRIP